MRNCIPLALVLASLTQTVCAGENETVFDLKAILAPPLQARTTKTTEKDGIVTEEVMFHATKDGDKSVDIFALFAYPKGAKKLPAFVWNQGGLGQANTYWTDFGARRGYAVVCIDFPMPGYRSSGGYPIVSGLELGKDPRKAPIYFGAVALLRAVSYLETRPEVDRDRIGMAGSSWGGFYTTLMAGIDPRLKAATSMFGTGNLQLGNVWWDGAGVRTRDADQREHWRTTLDPAWRLKQTTTPVAWFTGTNDNFYWMPSISKTYEQASGPKHLTLIANWDHALSKDVGEQVFSWLDIHLRGKPAFVRVGATKIAKEGKDLVARWTFEAPTARQAASAELLVSFGDGDWRGRYWLTIPAQIQNGACSAIIPPVSLPVHAAGAVLDMDGFRSSTPLVRVVPAELGFQNAAPVPDYNGCALWGGFEETHIKYLKTHGYPVPMVSPLAKEGKQAALFKAGDSPLPPIYATVGVPHRFSCWLKAERPTSIKLTLNVHTPGKTTPVQTTFKVGAEWTQATLDTLPPQDMVGHLRGTITVPPRDEVLMDDMRFSPAMR